MARRKIRNTKTRTKTRTVTRTVSRVKNIAKGGLMAGAIAGAGGQIIGKFINIGGFTQPVVDIATGMYLRNETLQTLGGRAIGAQLASGIGQGSKTAGGSLV